MPQLRPSELLTHTIASISSVSQVTGTGEATRGVGTDSISATVMSSSGTLINICNQIPTELMCPNYAAINYMPHFPHYRKGWEMGGDWEI